MKRWDFCGCRRRRRSEENGFIEDERRSEKSRVSFVGVVDIAEGNLMLSAQPKLSETSDLEGSGWF